MTKTPVTGAADSEASAVWERLWTAGPAPGEASDLDLRRVVEPRITPFAQLAHLLDLPQPGAQAQCLAQHTPSPQVSTAATRPAELDDASHALGHVVASWAQDRTPQPQPVTPDDRHMVTVYHWAVLGRAVLEIAAGRRSAPRHTLLTMLRHEGAPLRARVVAAWTLGGDGPYDNPRTSARSDALSAGARIASEAGWVEHAASLDLAAAFLDVEQGRNQQAQRRMLALLDGPLAYGPLALMLQSALAHQLPLDRASPLLANAVAAAAKRGDDLTYATLITAGARMYARAGDHASAVLVLTNGISQLLRGGSPRAGQLTRERQTLSEQLGPDAYALACEGARALLARDRAAAR